ncbi:uncharacterized protein LOC143183667 isoform X1 [Calliopsis andreniformis]|uniref:uncharacterized protein LOC143183667 isoform X1 n=1 Tax=Calliopsis andreniformis TaxID=337506 RepID=UPI003FCC5183
MWMTLAGGLQAFASASAEETVNVAEEDVSDATIPPDAIPSFDGNLPTPQQLLEMIDSMSGISEEEKATLKEDLLKSIQGQGFDGNPVAGNAMTMETLILLSLLGVVALIFGNVIVSSLHNNDGRIANCCLYTTYNHSPVECLLSNRLLICYP